MTRYYNENPQVTLWREIAAEAQETSRSYARLLKDLQRQFDEIAKISEDAMEISKRYKQTIEDYKSFMRMFDSLPWYMKAFYKFKV